MGTPASKRLTLKLSLKRWAEARLISASLNSK
jgi:hypothetical protein